MAKKQRPPPCEAGDYVHLRGRRPTGYLMHVNERGWAFVWWDCWNDIPGFDYHAGPWYDPAEPKLLPDACQIVHINELEPAIDDWDIRIGGAKKSRHRPSMVNDK